MAKSAPYVLVFFVAVAVYGLTSYAGIRSADGEVVFEVCAGLRARGTFAVQPEAAWKGFGVAPGRDGRTYGIFGPAQSIACVPFLLLADAIDSTRWFDRAAPQRSHTIGAGMRAVLTAAPLPPAGHPEREMHARRSLVAWMFNSVVGALGVVAFFQIAGRLARQRASALMMTAAFALCSLHWPYSGTFFSEPLATLFVLLSFSGVCGARADAGAHDEGGQSSRRARALSVALAGVALGIATAAHVTAVLFVPFWAVLVGRPAPARARLVSVAFFLGGAAAILCTLGLYNAARFGSLWETGRSWRAEEFGYGRFQFPGHGLWALLLAPGKGLLLFCPVVLLGIVAWPAFLRRDRLLAFTLASAFAARVVFIAARSDWHGGFSLGPRYLVMAVPLLLLPAVAWLDLLIEEARLRPLIGVAGFLWACALQQLYFVMGEIFSYLHFIKWQAAAAGVDVFARDDLYLQPRYSPLIGLLDGFRGPFLFKSWSISNSALWWLAAVTLSALAAALLIAAHRRFATPPRPSAPRSERRPP